MIASTTLLLVFKVMKTGKPAYLANKLEIIREAGMAVRGWGGPIARVPNYQLDVSRAGFIYRGAMLYIGSSDVHTRVGNAKHENMFKCKYQKGDTSHENVFKYSY